MKSCSNCHELKPLEEFYKHPSMSSGYLNKCKACTRDDVRVNYRMRHEQYRAYEAQRSQTTERREKQKEYAHRKKQRYPEKVSARNRVASALKSGRLTKEPCAMCGTTFMVEAHHEDYSKPLNVQWLCHCHHRQLEGRSVKAEAEATTKQPASAKHKVS